MTTVIFVHGTSVRRRTYYHYYEQIKQGFSSQKLNVDLVECYWGGAYGAKLHKNGVSIPDYNDNLSTKELTETGKKMALWNILYEDPLFELRILAESQTAVSKSKATTDFKEQVENFQPSPNLQEKLKEGDILHFIIRICHSLHKDNIYNSACTKTEIDDEFRGMVARSIIAQAIFLLEKESASSDAESPDPFLVQNYYLRDEIVKLLTKELNGVHKNTFEKSIKALAGVVAKIAWRATRRFRKNITSNMYPFPSDIAVYLARGDSIRDHLAKLIDNINDDSIILLGHSLGGIICADTLIAQKEVAQKVKLLITVGSQVPFLYELNGLPSLKFGDPLPEHFPRHWLNIYDTNDALSFIGKEIFGSENIEDIRVDNGRSFPESHSAYWMNQNLWKELTQRIPPLLKK